LQYKIQALERPLEIRVQSYIDGDVVNRDSNYDERFWELDESGQENGSAYVQMRTKKTNFVVRATVEQYFYINETRATDTVHLVSAAKVSEELQSIVVPGALLTVEKRMSMVTSQNYTVADLKSENNKQLTGVADYYFQDLVKRQAEAWTVIWDESDIEINGDIAAQQAIRFNIFQLYQTYTGKDSRLNIGPKGFTGEKYGGVTYWDTEAYCIPFYLATQTPDVARNLLLYRYNHLPKAIENAQKLGFTGGAALYPMVTINGEECHIEWEITFEEIHRNGAIAYAIYNYVRYTGDSAYLVDYGLEVLIAICRFWAQRVNWSIDRNKYVMLGVTGPNEYENNVNNNWYSNRIAAWCLEYTLEAMSSMDSDKVRVVLDKVSFDDSEAILWRRIIREMYYPEDATRGIFLQQDGFLDKDLIAAADLPASERPLNQHWSWDRILRSCFIKQADVLQGLYFLEDRYDLATIERNYNFYEPMTVHESSLSPCVHAILAAKLGKEDKAYEFYLRTSRLDLDDYNNDTEDGLHITSMAGTWMAIVEGFAGMRVQGSRLSFRPILPKRWDSYRFRVNFRGANLQILVKKESVEVHNSGAHAVEMQLVEELFVISANETRQIVI
jgi:maltose phosphorylase